MIKCAGESLSSAPVSPPLPEEDQASNGKQSAGCRRVKYRKYSKIYSISRNIPSGNLM